MNDYPSILFLTQFYPTPTQPHHGIFFRDHAEALAEYTPTSLLHVQTPSLREHGGISLELDYFEKNGVKTLHSTKPVISHRFSRSIRKAERIAVLEGFEYLTGQLGGVPELIIAQCVLPSGTWARWIFEEFRIPYGTIEHFTFLDKMLANQADEISYVYERASFVATVSETMLDLLSESGYTSPLTFHLGNVAGREFENRPWKAIPKHKPFRWLFVGPDLPKKGLKTLYKVFSKLPESQWELTIIGDGAYKEFKNDIPFSKKVRFRNSLQRSEMIREMQDHDALISTSQKETFGMAVLEMLTLGKPVVVTKSGGPEFFVRSQDGIVVEQGNIAELREAVLQIMEDFKKFEPKKIRKSALERFGSKAFARKLLSEVRKRHR